MKKLYSCFKLLSFIFLISAGSAQGMELAVPQQQTSDNRVKSLVSIGSKYIADRMKSTGDLTDFNLVCKDIQDLIAIEFFDVSNPDPLLKSIQACSLIPNDIVSDALKFCFLKTKTLLTDQEVVVAALNYACMDKDLNSVKIILNATDPSILMGKFICMTPLYEASRSGCTEIVNEIIKVSGDNAFNVITAMHRDDMDLCSMVLHWPIWNGHTEVIKTILDAAGDKAFDLITLKDRMRDSLWFFALNRNNSEIIKIFLDVAGSKACDLICMHHETFFEKENSIHMAVGMASVEIINLLIETVGENICEIVLSQDSNGETALHKVAQRRAFKEDDREKCIAFAKILIGAAGPYAQKLLSIKDNYGRTALDFALHRRNIELVEFLKSAQ